MEKNELNLLHNLEYAEAYLDEDITALSYIQQEYFGYKEADKDFLYKYNEMQNALSTLFKSMLFNIDSIRKAIDDGYEMKDTVKEAVA